MKTRHATETEKETDVLRANRTGIELTRITAPQWGASMNYVQKSVWDETGKLTFDLLGMKCHLLL